MRKYFGQWQEVWVCQPSLWQWARYVQVQWVQHGFSRKSGTIFRDWNIPVAGKGVSLSVQSHLTEQVFLFCQHRGANSIFISFSSKEMLDIMKAIYDMMGKCTYPILKEETPRQHVEVFFQASEPLAAKTVEQAFKVSWIASLFFDRRWIRTKTVWWP